jgi:aryl-alcohol dehydrogenase-like predicted oxidoreductase
MTMRDDTVGDPDRDPAAVVHAALDAGVTMVDTAHLYGNEALVGRAVAPRRDEVLLATKFGVLWRADGDWYVRADAAFVRESCEASLQRLGLETIDLYYLHHLSDETSIEETVGAMADLVREGKVRGLGLSNVTEEDLRRAHAVHPIVAVQERWSLMHLNVESMVPTAAELGVAVVAYSPTDHGHLHTSAGPASVLADVAARHGVRQVRSHWPRCSTAPNGGGSRSSRCPVRPASGTRGSTPPPRTCARCRRPRTAGQRVGRRIGPAREIRR